MIPQVKQRSAFTLLEVLISIALLGIVVVALFSTVSMMRDSNEQLYNYLQKAKKVTKATQVLYQDIIGSDGNLTIKKDDFTRLCIEETRNSLYALSLAKVCWVVMKKENILLRVEGNKYDLPTRLEDKVEVNRVMRNVELFDVYHEKDKVLVALKQKGKEPVNFMIQGIIKSKPKKLPPKKPTDSNTTNVTATTTSDPVVNDTALTEDEVNTETIQTDMRVNTTTNTPAME
jgi:prepilin-type N-terminal cleavage/methylation domain-containing protein